jgi:hypothetical protein
MLDVRQSSSLAGLFKAFLEKCVVCNRLIVINDENGSFFHLYIIYLESEL